MYCGASGTAPDSWPCRKTVRCTLRRQSGGYYFRPDYPLKVVAELRKHGDQVARLVGPHHEVGLVVNVVPGTTFDRDRFSMDSQNELQLFNYDFWFTVRAAGELYPVSHDVSYEVAKKNLRLQHEYILCRTLLALAVAMVVTDGSIQLSMRKYRQA